MRKLLIVVIGALALAGCGRTLAGADAEPANGVRAWLDQPLNGVSLPTGATQLKAHARNEAGGGISSIAFVVNGSKVGDVSTDAGAALASAELAWTPPAPGEYIILAQAFSDAGSATSAAARVCIGADLVAAPSSGICGPPQPTSASVAVAPTRPTATSFPSRTPTATQAVPATPSATSQPATATPSQPAPSATGPVATRQPSPTPTRPAATRQPSATPTRPVVVSTSTPTGAPSTTPTRQVSPTATPTLTPISASSTPTLSPSPTRPAPDTEPPVLVGSIATDPLITYYGPCRNAEPGRLSVSLSAADRSGIGAASLTYTFLSSRGGALGGSTIQMRITPTANGATLSAAVDIAKLAPEYLGGNDGLITYAIDMSDTVGNQASIQGANFEVRACRAAPTDTPAPPQDTAPPQIARLSGGPDPVFYGTCSADPTRATISALVSDDSSLGNVTLSYRFRSDSGAVGGWTSVAMSGDGGTYRATINVGAEAYEILQGTNGALEYQVSASDDAGNQSDSDLGTITVIYCIG